VLADLLEHTLLLVSLDALGVGQHPQARSVVDAASLAGSLAGTGEGSTSTITGRSRSSSFTLMWTTREDRCSCSIRSSI